MELYTYEALEPGEVTIELCFDSQENGHETAGEVFATVTVPVLPSEALQAAPELSVPSDFLKASAVIGSLTLDAGTLRLTLQAPTLDSYLNARGDGALDTLVKGYFGQDTENPTELDAQVVYRRSWNGALNELFADAALEFADGTQTPLSALFENSACFFSASLSETRDELGLYTFEAPLNARRPRRRAGHRDCRAGNSLCGLALIFRRVFEICVGVDAHIDPREVTNSPQISVKRSVFCRGDVGIAPYEPNRGNFQKMRQGRAAVRRALLILPRKPSAFHFPAHNHTAHDRGLRRSRPGFRGARARG